MCRFHFVFSMTISVIILLSCSGNRNSAVQPDLRSNPSIQTNEGWTAKSDSPNLWGLYDVVWSPSRKTFDSVPLRSAMFSVNVIKFINGSGTNLTIKVNSIQQGTDAVDFDLDIGIRHPFPGLNIYTGFDVMGVFMGQGSSTYPGPEGFAIWGSNDQQMLNPDGYTRRFNAPEFTGAGQIMPLQGYFPGSKGSPGYTPTAVLNPYKYYADGLDAGTDALDYLGVNASDRGCFRPGSTNTRNFRIRMPKTLLKFQYAILANWEPNKNHPQPPANLDDFPASANSEEAVAISTYASGDAWWANESNHGGHVTLDITPWDWSASCSNTMDEYSIKLYSPAWTGPFLVDMTPTVLSSHHYTFQASISADDLVANGDQPVWVEVDYPGHDYTSPVGVPNNASGMLASYFTTQVHILDHDPNPVITDNFVYAFADSTILEFADELDNPKLFENMLNLPLTGPYAENKKVMFYHGHTTGYTEYVRFSQVITDLGYESVYVPAYPYTPLDTSGVKMLFLVTFFSISGELYSPEEIQQIKDLINGGGVCVLVIDYADCYHGFGETDTVDQLISELKLDITCPMDGTPFTWNCIPYIDFTPDPITEGLTQISGKDSGRFETFGDAVTLMRGTNIDGIVYNAICKSPWRG